MRRSDYIEMLYAWHFLFRSSTLLTCLYPKLIQYFYVQMIVKIFPIEILPLCGDKQNIFYRCIPCFVVIFLQHANGDNAWIGIDGNTGEITDMREIGVCSWWIMLQVFVFSVKFEMFTMWKWVVSFDNRLHSGRDFIRWSTLLDKFSFSCEVVFTILHYLSVNHNYLSQH